MRDNGEGRRSCGSVPAGSQHRSPARESSKETQGPESQGYTVQGPVEGLGHSAWAGGQGDPWGTASNPAQGPVLRPGGAPSRCSGGRAEMGGSQGPRKDGSNLFGSARVWQKRKPPRQDGAGASRSCGSRDHQPQARKGPGFPPAGTRRRGRAWPCRPVSRDGRPCSALFPHPPPRGEEPCPPTTNHANNMRDPYVGSAVGWGSAGAAAPTGSADAGLGAASWATAASRLSPAPPASATATGSTAVSTSTS